MRRKNKLSSKVRRIIKSVAANDPSIDVVNLASKGIGDDGAKKLAEALRGNATVTKLLLRNNRIGAEGARALAEALRHNTVVTTIDLQSNDIGAEGAKALAEALKQNSTITTLDLESNSIGVKGVKALADALRHNSTVTKLDLWGNGIGAEGAKALAGALLHNSAITWLSLWGNGIGADLEAKLERLVRINRESASSQDAHRRKVAEFGLPPMGNSASELSEGELNAVEGAGVGLVDASMLVQVEPEEEEEERSALRGRDAGSDRRHRAGLRGGQIQGERGLRGGGVRPGRPPLLLGPRQGRGAAGRGGGERRRGGGRPVVRGAESRTAPRQAALPPPRRPVQPLGLLPQAGGAPPGPGRRRAGGRARPDVRQGRLPEGDGAARHGSTMAVPAERTSKFYANLVKEDKCNINLKITELIPLIEDVHDAVLFYTLVNFSYKSGGIATVDWSRIVAGGLRTVSTATACPKSIALFRLLLDKAFEDGALTGMEKNELDREAEVTRTSHAPLVQELRERIVANTAGIDGLDGSVEALDKSVEKFKSGIRRQGRVQTAVGLMGAVLNALSFGAAGSALSGAVSATIGCIVDFGDVAHIQAAVASVGDASVKEAFEAGLSLAGDPFADQKLQEATKEGNPIVTIAFAAKVIDYGIRLLERAHGSQPSHALGGVALASESPAKKKPAVPLVARLRSLEDQLLPGEVAPYVLGWVSCLEELMFGSTQEGTLLERVAHLEKELGVD